MSHKVVIDGKEQEVFTKEEMEAKVKESGEAATKTATEASTATATKAAEEAVEKYKQENPDKTEELDQAKTDLEKATKKLEDAEGEDGSDGGDDSEQIKRLKDAKETAEKALKESQEKMQKDIDTIKNTLVGNIKEDLLNNFSGNDQDLRKKLELEYDGFLGEAVTKDEITARMEKAVTLVTGEKPKPGSLDNISSSGEKGDGDAGAEAQEKEATPNQKAIGKVLGVSEEDRKKYGPGGEKDPNKSESVE